jgi:hypothetical protein
MGNLKGEDPIDDQHGQTVCVLSGCQAIFRVIDPNKPEDESRKLESALFHVPTFPSVEAIDPSEKLYEKRDELDADLVELLLCLDWKINLLIKILSPLSETAFYPYRAVISEISTSFMKIVTQENLQVDTPVEVHFVLPILPFKELFIRGKVVHISGRSGEYGLSVDSYTMKESDREHLIRYIVKRQFQIKRDHLRNGPALGL